MPLRIPRRRQISKCSRVWGLMPSSAAAMTKPDRFPSYASQHVADETLVTGHVNKSKTKRSPLGAGNSRCADPMSMVMPRRFSSSVVGVYAGEGFTRDVLP